MASGGRVAYTQQATPLHPPVSFLSTLASPVSSLHSAQIVTFLFSSHLSTTRLRIVVAPAADRPLGDLLCLCRQVSSGIFSASEAWHDSGQVSGCLSPALLYRASGGVLCVYVPACHATEGRPVGIFSHTGCTPRQSGGLWMSPDFIFNLHCCQHNPGML